MGAGVDPVSMIAVNLAGKALGSAFGGGGAQAAPAQAPNAFSAGLMGQGEQPPLPERNPAFSDPIGDATGKAILDERPKMKAAMQSMFDAEDARRPNEGMAAASMFERKPDAQGSFQSRPWTTETVQGVPVTAATDSLMPGASGASPSAFKQTPPVQPPMPAQMQPQAMAGVPSAFNPAPASAPGAPAQPATGTGLPNMFGLNEGYSGLQKWLKETPQNPLAQVGMSLLASGFDGSNPWTQMRSNLGDIPRLELAMQSGQIAQAAADRATKQAGRSDAEDERERALTAALAAMMGKHATSEREGTSRVARGAAKVIR